MILSEIFNILRKFEKIHVYMWDAFKIQEQWQSEKTILACDHWAPPPGPRIPGSDTAPAWKWDDVMWIAELEIGMQIYTIMNLWSTLQRGNVMSWYSFQRT